MSEDYAIRTNQVKFFGSSIHYFSLCSVQVEAFQDEQSLGKFTGTFYQENDRVELISNWHAFSGRCANCGQPLDRMGRVPNRLRLKLFRNNITIKNSLPADLIIFDVSIVSEDGNPIWKQTSSGQEVDIASIKFEIESFKNAILASFNKVAVSASDLSVGTEVFVVGFPEKVPLTVELPVWKRGTIASEAVIRDGQLTRIMVDAPTRKGMSGSPVYALRRGGFVPNQRNVLELKKDYFIPIGVYSGRIDTSDRLGAELGIIWPLGFVQQVVDTGLPGSHKLTNKSELKYPCSH